MTKQDRILMELAHGLYETLLDQDSYELSGQEENAETSSLKAQALGKKLFLALKERYGEKFNGSVTNKDFF